MRYSDEMIEEVRVKNDIVDVISQYVKLQRKGSSYFGLCPFHNEKTPSFSVSPAKQMYYCFGCGAGGNVFTFIMEYENFSFGEALKFLADRAGVELPQIEYSKEAQEQANLRNSLLEIQKAAASYFYYNLRRENGKTAYQYLKSRGLSDETMQKFGLGYSDKYSNDLYQYLKKKGYRDELLLESGLFNLDERRGVYDKFWNRVIFPIMDVNNRVIGFGGRVMGEGAPKYLNSPETKIFDKSRNLYGLNVARTSRKKQLIICEGYMDVISMHQAGFTNAVASLGTALTSGHASLLKRYTDEVLLLYDSDEAGVKAALRGIPILRNAGVRSKVVNLKPYKDPDEFIKAEGPERFEERLSQAMNSFLFLVQTRESQYDLSDPQGKTDFFRDIAARLLEFEEELERNNYIEAIARKYGIGIQELKKMVNQLAMKGTAAQNYSRPKELRQKQSARENGVEKSQKLMLTWIVSYPKIFPVVQEFLSPDDFTTPLYHKVAEMVFEQAQGEQINPAKLLNQFMDSGEQSEVASLFHAMLHLESPKEQKKALTDAIAIMKKASLEAQISSLAPDDMKGLQELLYKKKELSNLGAQLQSLNISFE